MLAKVVTVLPWQYTLNLHSIFCKIDANSNKLFVLLETQSSFRFQYRLLTKTTFFEIAVYIPLDSAYHPARVAIVLSHYLTSI